MAAGHVVPISVRRFGRLPPRSRVRYGVYVHIMRVVRGIYAFVVRRVSAHARLCTSFFLSEIISNFFTHMPRDDML